MTITDEMLVDAFKDFRLLEVTLGEGTAASRLIGLAWSEIVAFFGMGHLEDVSKENDIYAGVIYIALKRKYDDVTYEDCQQLPYDSVNRLAEALLRERREAQNLDPKAQANGAQEREPTQS